MKKEVRDAMDILKLAVGAIAVLGVIVLFLPQDQKPPSGSSYRNRADSDVSYHKALRVLTEDMNKRLDVNVFGSVSGKGRHATVTLEEGYFINLEPDARIAIQDGIRDAWFNKCYGSSITFKSPSGETVAEY